MIPTIFRSAPTVCTLACILMMIAGCQQGPAAPAAPSAADQQAVRDTLLQHARSFSKAFMNQDIEAIASAYTDSAYALPGNGPIVRGADSIAALFRVPPGREVVHHEIQPFEVQISGDRAYDVGLYEVQSSRGDSLMPMYYGKYTIVWAHTDAGWKMHVDMWSGRPAPDTTGSP